MAPTKYADRTIPKISLHDFSSCVDEITIQLISAAETDGFFCLINHDISPSQISHMFTTSASFFPLPDSTKSRIPFTPKNTSWEKNSQVRPSTGQPDQKESYQIQFGANMEGSGSPIRSSQDSKPSVWNS